MVSRERPELVLANAARNLTLLRERGYAHWGGHYYVLVRKALSPEEVVD